MNRRNLLALLLIGLATASGVVSHADGPVDPPCIPMSGTFYFTLFEYTGPTTAHGVADVVLDDGTLGTADAQYFNIEQQGDGNGVIQLNGQHHITLPGGELFTYDEIHLKADEQHPNLVTANSRLYIVDGTGVYTGATGLLHTHGTLDFINSPPDPAPSGGIDFKGKVCVP